MINVRMDGRSQRLHATGNDSGSVIKTYVISISCHLIFLVILIYAPSIVPEKKFSPRVINVDLIALPKHGMKPVANKQRILKPEKQKSKNKTKATLPEKALTPKTFPKENSIDVDPEPSKSVSLASKKKTNKKYGKKKVKKSLKKKTFNPSKVVKSAIKKIEKKTEESRPKPVADAIDRLKQHTGKYSTEQDSAMTGGTGTIGKRILDELHIYKLEVAYHIQKNWAFSEQLAGGKTGLVTWLVIKIMPNGEIRDIWFEKKSGNSYLDDSAYKAVKKSNPLPPLPKEHVYPFYNVGLRFTPSGVK